jgi:hypothetical protein
MSWSRSSASSWIPPCCRSKRPCWRKTHVAFAVPGALAVLSLSNATTDERDFEMVAKAVKETIEHNQPEQDLDRLHTFVMKYVRTLCARHKIVVDREKPLHSLFEEYVKKLRGSGLIR